MDKVTAAADALARMETECLRRGYDPELMLGLARALPHVQFSRDGGYYRPVWRGKILKRRPLK